LLPDLDALPSLEELKVLIATAPTTKIPASQLLFNAIEDVKPGLLEISNFERTKLTYILEAIVAKHGKMFEIVGGHTEDQLHQVYDVFFQDLLRVLLDFKHVRYDIDRNATEEEEKSITTKSGDKKKGPPTGGEEKVRPRPDYLFHIQNLMFLRGEEKRDGVALNLAQEDLRQKMMWNPAIMGRYHMSSRMPRVDPNVDCLRFTQRV
jgi:hypothetical protein